MKCPHCNRTIGVVKQCPYCGGAIDYDGKTVFYQRAATTKIGWRDIFSETFKKHKSGDMERSLRSTFASEADMLAGWMKPWLFARFFLYTVALLALLIILHNNGGSPYATPMILVLGNALIPVTLLLFLWEVDIPKHVRFVEMLGLLLFGGVISLLIAMPLNSAFDGSDMIAGLTEEPAKLLIAILFIVLTKRRFYVLDGLVIGAAVAAGFAFIESIGYVAWDPPAASWMSTGMWVELVGRAVNSLAGHVLYTAPFVGGLCWAMEGKRFRLRHLADMRFLMFFLLGVVVHMFNNAGIPLPGIRLGYFTLSLRTVIKILVLWPALLYLINVGLKEVLVSSAAEKVSIQPLLVPQKAQVRTIRLLCTGGDLAGTSISLADDMTLTIGRDPATCNMVVTGDSKGVSRVHCRVRRVGDSTILEDLNSTYGTWVLDDSREERIVRYTLRAGQSFRLGKSAYVFALQEEV